MQDAGERKESSEGIHQQRDRNLFEKGVNMLKREFNEHHIRELQKISGRDPALIERAVYAFGLLDAISTVGMPFVLKAERALCCYLNIDEVVYRY